MLGLRRHSNSGPKTKLFLRKKENMRVREISKVRKGLTGVLKNANLASL